MNFQAAARAITGSKDKQEDAWRVYDLKGAAGGGARRDGGGAVAGGARILGGGALGRHQGGKIASKITADTFVQTFFSLSGNAEDRLRQSLKGANDAIAAAQAKEPALKDMGATLVAGFFEDDRMAFVSVGDSLIYRYRDGELHRVNMDHSYFEIADREALGKDDRNLWREVISRKGRDSITIAVLGRALEDFGHSPQIDTRKVLPGDLMIFSSDGLETLSPVQIQNFIRELLPQGVGAVADGLIKAVDGIGGNRNYQDNATLVVLQADAGGAISTAQVTPNREAAKTAPTAPVAPKTAMIPPTKAEAPQAASASARAAAGSTGTISSAARSGKWSPTKFVLLIAIALIAVAAVLYGVGVFGGRTQTDATKIPPPPSDTTKVTPAPDQKNAPSKNSDRPNTERQRERQQSDSPAPPKQERTAPPASSPSPTREQNYLNPRGEERKPVVIHLDGGPMLPQGEVEEFSSSAYPRSGYTGSNGYYAPGMREIAPAERYARYRAPYEYDCE